MVLSLAGAEEMEKKMETTKMGYIGTTKLGLKASWLSYCNAESKSTSNETEKHNEQLF